MRLLNISTAFIIALTLQLQNSLASTSEFDLLSSVIVTNLAAPSSSQPLIEILDDYQPSAQGFVADNKKESQEIVLVKPSEKEDPIKPSIIWRAGRTIGWGILRAGRYCIKLGSGSAAAYYLSASTNQIIATTASSILLQTTANPAVGSLVYAFGIYALPAVTTVLVWRVGYEAPDILYYTAKLGWKTVSLAARGVKYTGQQVLRLWQSKKQRDEFIELVNLTASQDLLEDDVKKLSE